MKKIKGIEAIEYKKNHPNPSTVELNKYNDPTEEERFDLSVEEAEEIAREDAGLLYVEIDD